MQTHFGPDFFSNNRRALRERLGSDAVIVLTGNGNMQRGADEPSAFHQDSNFWYLTGLNGPDFTLVLVGYEAYVIVPSMNQTRQAFDGSHDIAAYSARSGITDFVGERVGWARLKATLTSTTTVATLASLPVHMKRHGLYSLPYRRRLIARLRRMHPGLELIDIRNLLAGMRAVKQPEELGALREAIRITTQTLNDIAEPKLLGTIEHEYQLEAHIGFGFRSRSAEGHAFAPIVGAGTHATTLHYLANNGPVNAHDLIVVDIGAQVDHYAADISRTLSKQPISGRSADVFKAVEAVQDYALSLIKPGTLLADYERAIEIFMGAELRKLGLIDSSERSAIRRFFPHATSHFLGLDTHDVGDYAQPLQPGMVITCEPGIYISEEGVGVRIEDDILVTESGFESLSAACPRRLTTVQ